MIASDKKDLYQPVVFDEQYANENSSDRYARLFQHLEQKNFNGSIPEIQKVLRRIQYCWTNSQSREIVRRPQPQLDAEAYLIQALARLVQVYENPSDTDNLTQLNTLVEDMPNKDEATWYDLKALLINLTGMALLAVTAFSLGANLPLGLVLGICCAGYILFASSVQRECNARNTIESAQPLKSELQSVVETRVGFFESKGGSEEDDKPDLFPREHHQKCNKSD